MSKEHFIDDPEYIELTSNIADLMLQKRLGFDYKNFIIQDEEGNETYTPKGQKLFEHYLDEVVDLFDLNGVLPMDLGSMSFLPDPELVENIKPEGKVIPFKGKIGSISGEKKDE
tara:strand:+ start:290 stop:631 length:342 start_codon:yes stop_codon:yes gene_type:complete